MEDRIAANEAFVAAQPAVDKAQDDRIKALEGLFEGENSVEAKIAAAQAAAEAKAAELDTALENSLKGYVDDAQEAAEAKAAELDAALETSLKGYADQAETDAKAHAESYTNDALTWGSF